MKKLTKEETQQINGGWTFVLGVVGGIAGNYLYDSMGGADGINDMMSSYGDWMTESAEAYAHWR